MSRPASFKAGGFKWKIEYIGHKAWPTERGHDAMGICHCDQHRISVRLGDEGQTYSEGAIIETLLHELMHVCYYITGASHFEDNQTEENTIRFLSPALLAVLRDNLPLARYLLAD